MPRYEHSYIASLILHILDEFSGTATENTIRSGILTSAKALYGDKIYMDRYCTRKLLKYISTSTTLHRSFGQLIDLLANKIPDE